MKTINGKLENLWSRLIQSSVLLVALLFSQQIKAAELFEFIDHYCADCHNPVKAKGKLDLISLLESGFEASPSRWNEILSVLRGRDMPPPDEPEVPRPSEQEYRELTDWLATQLPAQPEDSPLIEGSVEAFVDHYCVNCHNPDENKGSLNLDEIKAAPVESHPEIWEKVLTKLQSRQMPPARRERPNEETYQSAIDALIQPLDQRAKSHHHPGRVATFRRLNRTEYQNAIRDLLAVKIDAGTLLPKDEESFGFDNITVGTLSPSLVDRYITAAQKIARLAVGRPSEKPGGDTFRIPPDVTQEKHVPGLPLGTRGGLVIDYTFPQDGHYEIQVTLARDRNEHVEGLRGTHNMDILIDRQPVQSFVVTRDGHESHAEVDKHLKTRQFITGGPKQVGVTFQKKSFSLLENKRQPFEAHFNLHRHPRLTPAVFQVSITGPFDGQGATTTPSRARIFTEYPSSPHDEEPMARKILGRIMMQAFRRAVSEEDIDRQMRLYRDTAAREGFEAGIEKALTGILVSPEFLLRVERDPVDAAPGSAYPITDLELASRLSFFLWSSLPDGPLLADAMAGSLRESGRLESHVKRLLQHENASNLATNFANQWLHLRNLAATVPDLRQFPDFDDNLRQSFREETERFFQSILKEDRSVLDLLRADYTFLNERLARHYGIPGILGSRFRRVNLTPEHHRGGLLRQGSILTVTSYATRTSPVLRGNWILDNLLGTPPPPPPPDVPDLEDNKVDATLSMRERLAEHRANPACASCHDLMDPIGFALENFDAVGQWRSFENGETIDVSGGLPDGSEFAGVAKLEEALLERPELFAQTLTAKLLTFALGRGLTFDDAPAIREILRQAKAENYRFSSLILGIVDSVPFQMRSTPKNQSVATQ